MRLSNKLDELEKLLDFEHQLLVEEDLPTPALLAYSFKLLTVAKAASGLSCGVDWNNGTHAEIYRPKLIEALAELERGE